MNYRLNDNRKFARSHYDLNSIDASFHNINNNIKKKIIHVIPLLEFIIINIPVTAIHVYDD